MTTLTILHFNDVYNIEPRNVEPVGGAARQTTVIRQLAHLNPLVLFSGDALNPSTLSTVTHGKHMVPILNAMNVQCAVYGNHDFDFGIETLEEVALQTAFPWLMSNVMDVETGEPLANGLIKHTLEWDGIKIGLLGVVEEEWIATLAAIDKEDVVFNDYVTVASSLATELREQDDCDVVIALTHMRWPNDIHLAENVDNIDLFLGGHDHDYTVQQVRGKWVLKSGSDFQNMSRITMSLDEQKKVTNITVDKIDVDSSVEEAPDIKVLVQSYFSELSQKMDVVLGMFEVELDGRFSKIRTQETNLGTFICDIMLSATNSDVALLNSGTLRSDRLHPRGEFRMRDLMAVLPMLDPCVVLEITGAQMLEALENGVSQYPKMEGRFPQVAGMSFGFNPQQPAGARIDAKHVHIGDRPIVLNKTYRLTTKGYLQAGKDGYEVFKECKILVDEEDGPRLSTAVQNHFESLKLVQGLDHGDRHLRRRRSSLSMARRHSTTGFGRQSSLMALHDMTSLHTSKPSLARQEHVQDLSAAPPTDMLDGPPRVDYCHLSPENDGRIFIATKERHDTLLAQTTALASILGESRIEEEPLD